MFSRSLPRLIIVAIIAFTALLGITSLTSATARPQADLIVNPGESIQAAIDRGVDAGVYTDLALTQAVTPTFIVPGQTVSYTLAFTNQGSTTATDVLITDNLPPNFISLTVTSSGVPITQAAQSAWQVADLAPGDGGVITLSGALKVPWFTPNIFTNTAHITAATVETDTTNNTASAAVMLCGTIQCAIDAAHDGDTLVIPAGLYTESLTLSKPVSLTGVNSDTTILHAVAGQRVLTITGATISNSVVISGLTFMGGDVAGGNMCPDACGGALLLIGSASPSLQGIRIISNTAWQGGGVYATGPITIAGVRFIGNSSMYSGGAVYASTAAHVSASHFEGNTASYNAGGLYARQTATLINTDFLVNAATAQGGGLFAGDVNVPGTFILSNVKFISNTAGSGGAGAFVHGTAHVSDSRFENNRYDSIYYPGGLYADTVYLTNTDFISNSSVWGGGLQAMTAYIRGGRFERNSSQMSAGGLAVWNLYMTDTLMISNTTQMGGSGGVRASSAWIEGARFENNDHGALTIDSGPLVISNSFFISNSATEYGGGLLYAGLGTGTIINTVFAHNHTDNAGAAIAITARGHLNLVHTTIADNIRNPRPAIAVLSGTLSITDSIIANHAIGISNTGGTVTEDYNLFYGNITNTVGITPGTHSLVGDPHFVDLVHDDYHLAFGSAAIDHGVDAGVYTDLDGHVRPHGAGFDIGAYEYSGVVYRTFLPIVRR